MQAIKDNPLTVIRTGRGLTVNGTRITLYQLMDYIIAGDSWDVIQAHFPQLSFEQLHDVRQYIEKNYDDVVTEYKLVLQKAEAREQYWREQNQKHLATLAKLTPDPQQAHIRAKINVRKTELGLT